MRQQKHEHRNELVFLLDELLRQETITRDEYKRLNNFLSEYLASGESGSELLDDKNKNKNEEPVSKEENIKYLIHSITEYLIPPDRKELLELLKDFKDEAHEH